MTKHDISPRLTGPEPSNQILNVYGTKETKDMWLEEGLPERAKGGCNMIYDKGWRVEKEGKGYECIIFHVSPFCLFGLHTNGSFDRSAAKSGSTHLLQTDQSSFAAKRVIMRTTDRQSFCWWNILFFLHFLFGKYQCNNINLWAKLYLIKLYSRNW